MIDLSKITTLTAAEYLPLARRTLPADLTRKERLGMLTRGVCGEYGELSASESVEEIGDLLWYASLLVAEVAVDPCNFESFGSPITWLHMDGNRRDEALKKAIYHDVDTCVLEELAAEAMLVCQRSAASAGVDLGEVRLANIKKLIRRYPDGFVAGGGER